ncbi:MAG: hypothetical protein ACP5M1_12900 [Acidiphilium sp.]
MKKLISLACLASGLVALATMTTQVASASPPVKYYKGHLEESAFCL